MSRKAKISTGGASEANALRGKYLEYFEDNAARSQLWISSVAQHDPKPVIDLKLTGPATSDTFHKIYSPDELIRSLNSIVRN